MGRNVRRIALSVMMLGFCAQEAVAEVNFSGYGRFGFVYDGRFARGSTRLDQRFRLNIDGTAQTDRGFRFGVRIRLQMDEDSDGAAVPTQLNAPGFQMSLEGIAIRLGNIPGVFDEDSTIRFSGYEPGLIEQISQHSNFLGPYVQYDSVGTSVKGFSLRRDFGNLTVMGAYYSQVDEPDGAGFGDNYEFGLAYDLGSVTVGAAYGVQKARGGDIDYFAANAYGATGDLKYSFLIGYDDIGGKVSYGMSGRYRTSAVTQLVASLSAGGADYLQETFGVGFDHSLGGGVRMLGMIGRANGGDVIGDFGVRFDF